VDPTNQLIVLAFRGSDSYTNVFKSDDDTYLISTDFTCAGCAIGNGFWGAYLDARPVWLPSIQVQMNLHPTYKLITTGHSLGGVLSQVAGAQIRSNNIHVDVVSTHRNE
jgi:hypothetical protein